MLAASISAGLLALGTAFVYTCAAADFDELAAQAAAAREANDIPKAAALYKEALQIRPDWREGWWYLGTLYYDADQYPAAKEAFAELVRRAPNPAAWAFLGLCEFETAEYPGAQNHLEQALAGRLAPEIEPSVRFHLALLLTRSGRFDQAWRVYRSMPIQSVNNPVLMAGLAVNALNRPMLPRDVPANQQDFIAAVGQAVRVWLAGDSAAAGSAFQKLVLQFPKTPGIHGLYASFLLSTRPEDAMLEFERELAVNPHAAEARAMVALLLLRSGKTADASSYARKAAEERPDSALAQYAYGMTLADVQQAAAHLEAAEKLDPENFEYHVALAGVYSNSGRNGEARRERKLAIQLARENDPHRAP